MNEKEFINELDKIQIKINQYQLDQLKKYYELLVEWNEKINLTAITEKEQVYLKHFYDSATLCKYIDFKNNTNLCDVGTGAGFPGIIIKILFPELEVTLVDSLNKRINFLNIVIENLKLEKISAVHARIEEFALKNREKYDIVTARAVAPLNILLEYCIPLVKINKYFIPMKGNISQEIDGSLEALKVLNSTIIDSQEFLLPKEDSKRTIIRIKKISKTNKKYPRRYSEIKKNPL
jgi:16S rRNA (guanine527-N7)-methyltransferase